MKKFRPGDTLIFDPSRFNPAYWNGLTEEEKIRYYGKFGYGSEQTNLFTYLAPHRQQPGHCVLVSMQDGRVWTMCHDTEFRLATEDEV